MNNFEQALAEMLGAETLTKIQQATIGIAGAGGLGSNCAFNLVRSGFKKFIIIDYDKLEWSNLNRQFFFYHQVGQPKVEQLKKNLLSINPDLEITAFNDRLTTENLTSYFLDCQVVVEAFDKAEAKKMIINEYATTDKLLVSASGLAGHGDSDQIKIRKINETFYLVGDQVREASSENPPLSPRVNIAAAKQADIVLSWVLGKEGAEQ